MDELQRQKVELLNCLLAETQAGHKWERLSDGFLTKWVDRWISIEYPAAAVKQPILLVTNTKPAMASQVSDTTVLVRVAITPTFHLAHSLLYRLMKLLCERFEATDRFTEFVRDSELGEETARIARSEMEELTRLLQLASA